MQVYLNGRFLPAAEASIPAFDGGFLYGDGVYTTLRTYRGRAVDLQPHWRRLTAHAHALEIPLELELAALQEICTQLVRRNRLDDVDGRLRITVSRGGDPAEALPLRNLERLRPTILVTLVPVGENIGRWQQEGISAVVLGPAYARSHFPELKTLNGLTTVLALRQAARTGCQEALLTTSRGRLLEGAVSNIFLVRKGEMWTPAARGGFLPGLTRGRILELATSSGFEIQAANLDRRDLAEADEVFCASSVREILPVVTVDRQPVADGHPGPITRTLMQAYREAMSAGSTA